jgi:hypothetical protein
VNVEIMTEVGDCVKAGSLFHFSRRTKQELEKGLENISVEIVSLRREVINTIKSSNKFFSQTCVAGQATGGGMPKSQASCWICCSGPLIYFPSVLVIREPVVELP